MGNEEVKTPVLPPHHSPANQQAKAQTEQLTRMANEVTQPSWKKPVFWFSLVAAAASVVSVIVAIANL